MRPVNSRSDECSPDTSVTRAGMGGGRANVWPVCWAQPRGRRAALDGEKTDINTVSAGEEVNRSLLVQFSGLGRRTSVHTSRRRNVTRPWRSHPRNRRSADQATRRGRPWGRGTSGGSRFRHRGRGDARVPSVAPRRRRPARTTERSPLNRPPPSQYLRTDPADHSPTGHRHDRLAPDASPRAPPTGRRPRITEQAGTGRSRAGSRR